MRQDKEKLQDLKKRAVQVRANILEMIPAGKVGHLGGSTSIADIAAVLYFGCMNVYDDPRDPRRDRCIFSKGHAVLAQYACLVELGYFDREELHHVKSLDGTLQGHPDMDHTPGIEAVTGSLGQGLSVSMGMAMGLRLQKNPARVYCVLGDGELDEGQVWEAAMAAAAHQVDQLCAIVDRNGLQATDSVANVMPNGDLCAKWRAFGWHVIEIDGHCIAQILDALAEAETVKGKPTVIIANTVKGKGFPFAEGQVKYHNAALTAEEYALALQAVQQMREEADRA